MVAALDTWIVHWRLLGAAVAKFRKGEIVHPLSPFDTCGVWTLAIYIGDMVCHVLP